MGYEKDYKRAKKIALRVDLNYIGKRVGESSGFLNNKWILFTSSWNDGAEWIDGSSWNDG